MPNAPRCLGYFCKNADLHSIRRWILFDDLFALLSQVQAIEVGESENENDDDDDSDGSNSNQEKDDKSGKKTSEQKENVDYDNIVACFNAIPAGALLRSCKKTGNTILHFAAQDKKFAEILKSLVDRPDLPNAATNFNGFDRFRNF